MGERQPRSERVLWRLKPAWRSFFVYYATALFLAAVALKDTYRPEAGRPFPLAPAPALALAAAILLYVVLMRRAEFVVTNRRVVRRSALGLHQELELARIDELKVYQPIIQRLLGTGKIVMADSKDMASRLQFFGLEKPKRVRETLAELIEEARHGATG